jgi:uncharacterized membrane protein (UPF0182 family)
MYVTSTQSSSYPKLQDVIVVYGKQVSLAPTLSGALAGIFGSAPPGVTSGNSTGTGGTTAAIPSDVRNDVANGLSDYNQAQAALAAGNLGTYQSDVTEAGNLLQEANALLAQSSATTKSTSSPKSASTTTTSGSTVKSLGTTHLGAHA